MRPRFIFHGHAAAFGGRIVRPKDIVLESGQSFRLQHRGLSLVYALEPAGLTLSAPRSREYPEPVAVFSLVPSTLPV